MYDFIITYVDGGCAYAHIEVAADPYDAMIQSQISFDEIISVSRIGEHKYDE